MVGQDVMRCLMALGLVLQGLSFGAQAAPGGAVELYRYVNDKGVVVLDRQGVPPQYIGKGYQVLNDQGRVIRTVPPAPTAEELRQRKAPRPRPVPMRSCCACIPASRTSTALANGAWRNWTG